ncbi:MAG: hypothetical protein IAE65_08920 [Ignavibacteria bacterium]|nr:hypothetical protein [Ignavibacteria bacterium]
MTNAYRITQQVDSNENLVFSLDKYDTFGVLEVFSDKIDIEMLYNKLKIEHSLTDIIAKEVFNEMFKSGKSAGEIIKEKNLVQVSDDGFINDIILKVLSENKTEAERFKAGEKKLQGVLVGKIMKESKGKANPQKVNELLIKNLES